MSSTNRMRFSDLLRLERFHRIDHDVAHRPTRARLESAAGRGKLRLRPLVAVASCPPGRARRWDGIREALARGVIALRRETPAPRAAAGVRVQDVREVREIHRQAPPAPIRVAAMGRRGLREASEGGWEGGEGSVRNRRAGRGGDPNAIRQTVVRTKAVGRMNRGDNSPGAGRTERRISIPVSTAPAIVPARRLTPESSRVFPVRGRRRASVPCERAGAQFWVAANWAGGRPNRRGSRTTTDRGSSVVQCRIGRVGVG